MSFEKLQQEDPWFYSHYVYAASIVATRLRKYIEFQQSRLFDFGCGDGIMALGVSHSEVTASVTGLDITEAFKGLPQRASQSLQLGDFPSTLCFMQISAIEPLPFESNHFDGGYSWSVFEHVPTIDTALAEIYRVLKPRAVFFLQIEPLYFSPFGSHLQRLIDEPWAHLLEDEASYLHRVKTAEDTIPDAEKDFMYRENEFENVKNYLIGEYLALNKLTVNQLLTHILNAGFHVLEMQTAQVNQLAIPPVLLNEHSEYDLRTNEIQLVMNK